MTWNWQYNSTEDTIMLKPQDPSANFHCETFLAVINYLLHALTLQLSLQLSLLSVSLELLFPSTKVCAGNGLHEKVSWSGSHISQWAWTVYFICEQQRLLSVADMLKLLFVKSLTINSEMRMLLLVLCCTWWPQLALVNNHTASWNWSTGFTQWWLAAASAMCQCWEWRWTIFGKVPLPP